MKLQFNPISNGNIIIIKAYSQRNSITSKLTNSYDFVRVCGTQHDISPLNGLLVLHGYEVLPSERE